MTEPIGVRVDFEIPSAYIKYRKSAPVETRDVFENGAVAYDLDQAGSIVGLEILWFDETLTLKPPVFSPNSTTSRSREICEATWSLPRENQLQKSTAGLAKRSSP